jgi:hypothetical protein
MKIAIASSENCRLFINNSKTTFLANAGLNGKYTSYTPFISVRTSLRQSLPYNRSRCFETSWL